MLLLRRSRRDIETGGLRLLLLRFLLLLLLVELRLVLLWNRRHRRCRTCLEGLLLSRTGLEWLLLRSARLERTLLRSTRLERHLLRGSLSRKAGELRLKLSRRLRLWLLDAWEACILLLEGRRSLSQAGWLRRKGALLLLLLLAWLLSGLPEGASILLCPGAEAIASPEEGVGLRIHGAIVVETPERLCRGDKSRRWFQGESWHGGRMGSIPRWVDLNRIRTN